MIANTAHLNKLKTKSKARTAAQVIRAGCPPTETVLIRRRLCVPNTLRTCKLETEKLDGCVPLLDVDDIADQHCRRSIPRQGLLSTPLNPASNS